MKFQAWNFRLECVLCTTLAIVADEVKVVLFSCSLRDAVTRAMLPDIALLASNTMTAVILNSS